MTFLEYCRRHHILEIRRLRRIPGTRYAIMNHRMLLDCVKRGKPTDILKYRWLRENDPSS